MSDLSYEDAELPTIQQADTSTVTSVANSTTNVTLLNSNSQRKMALITNDGTGKAILYIKLGATASLTSFTIQVPALSIFELPLPCYTGQIDGIWDISASNTARITELT